MATYTYDGDPDGTGSAAQQRDAVRFLAQDTVATMRVSDEEIAWLISTEPNVYIAAAMVAELIAQKLAGGIGVTSKKVEDFELSYSTSDYLALAKSLRARGAGHQLPYCGGISLAEKAAVEADTDVPLVAVRRGQHDNPPGSSNTGEDRRNWGL